MTKHFGVTVTRDTTESCVTWVEANSPEEAEETALTVLPLAHVEWQADDTPCTSNKPYVTSCDEEV